jgi:malonate transporter
MTPILAVTVPFFALVLCGYLAARRHVLPESAIPGLNAFVLYFALPCLLFRFGANTPIVELLNPVVLGLYLASAMLIVFFTIAVTLSKTVHLQNAAFGALVAAFPNTGFMGVPLLAALLGPSARGPVICTDAGRSLRHQFGVHCHGAGPQRGGTRRARGRACVRCAARCPTRLPWSIVLGGLFSVAGLKLPGPAQSVVNMLADAATPVALFTIGAVLWRAGQHVSTRTPVAEYLPVALIKLFVHPLLVFALGAAAHKLGAPLSSFQLMVLTLAAALPSASNVSLLAERYGADNGRVARIIMTSTVLAFVSFPLLAWLFGVRPA